MLTYFTISSGDITSIMAVAGDMVGDFMPLIIVFVGLAIAFAIYHNFVGKK